MKTIIIAMLLLAWSASHPISADEAKRLPSVVAEFTDAQRRELILKAVAEADLIPDEQARMNAQWGLVSSLVRTGLRDEAFQQAMKLRTANPQACINSLQTIAGDAIKRGDQATVSKTWNAAKQSNVDSGTEFSHKRQRKRQKTPKTVFVLGNLG